MNVASINDDQITTAKAKWGKWKNNTKKEKYTQQLKRWNVKNGKQGRKKPCSIKHKFRDNFSFEMGPENSIRQNEMPTLIIFYRNKYINISIVPSFCMLLFISVLAISFFFFLYYACTNCVVGRSWNVSLVQMCSVFYFFFGCCCPFRIYSLPYLFWFDTLVLYSSTFYFINWTLGLISFKRIVVAS